MVLLVYFAFGYYNEQTDRINFLNSYLQKTQQAASISQLVDDLQTERRYSFGYVIRHDWRGELVIQRPRTDAALQRLENNGSGQLSKVESYTFLDQLKTMRTRIDNGQADPMEVMSFYTNVIFRLNTLNDVSVDNVSYLEPVMKEMTGQKLLSEMITYFGIIRANVYYALYTNQNGAQSVAGIKGVLDIYKSVETEFLLKTSDSARSAYKKITTSTALQPTIAYLQKVVSAQNLDSTYNAEKWWEVSANGVDQIKALQRSLLQQVQTGITLIYNNEKQSRYRALLFIIFSIVAVSALIIYFIRIITMVLNSLKDAALDISAGKPAGAIKVLSEDAIGSLALSIEKINQNGKSLAQAAESIGKGDFNIQVYPRSSEDVLGNAVVKMKNDLQLFRRENEKKLWIQEGIALINEHLRGEQTVKTLAREALDALTMYINGQVGLLYVYREGLLYYEAGYAVAEKASLPQEIKLGETLIGQAAIKKEPRIIENVPDDFVKVSTAGGSAHARYIMILPLVHNSMLEGVIEIGSIEAFNPSTIAFIYEVQSTIAIALQSAKSRARLQELFEETQAQAEELQAQHSELENINTELEAQTQKLQASEEELKVQQEELMQANQELEERSRLLEERNQMIVERNLEIQQKAEELELSTKYKSEFLANMSHELRTPLNSILLLSRLLSENNDKNLSTDQIEYAQVIQSSGQGLLSLIDEILDLSKIEAGKMDLEFTMVSLKEVEQDMRALFQPVAKDRSLEFDFQIQEGAPAHIETDKLRLEQILKNLLSNALKFTSRGSVKVSVEKVKDFPSFVCFKVKDTGIGIPQEKQQLIFEAFQQADGSTRRKFGGTGLGLSISRELAKLLGGEIKVHSEPGKGSEFVVYVPITKQLIDEKEELMLPEPKAMQQLDQPEQIKPRERHVEPVIPPAVPDDRAALKGQDKVILIVEDDTGFARALADYAHRKGYKVLTAVRGDEAIELARKFKPIGILLDIQLPVKDGWEVMEELKSDPVTRHIPVHIMSSLEAKKESIRKGAIDFINKPVALEQMQQVFKKIEEVLSKENKKVLIVEENPKHARALSYFLETFDVNSEISDDVRKGIDALKKHDVDCVILDMRIPDQHGYEALDAIKKEAGFENLPVIIFTGKNISKAEESRIKQYADSIVVKTAHSYQRILDEVSLFLHLVEENRQEGKQVNGYKRLGALKEVLTGKKILIADDDVRNIFSLTKALEKHQMQVFSAVDGKEALQQLEEHPDMNVVLMDIMMREMDGFEAIQRIRQQFRFRDLPVIAVTAKAMTGDREKCIRAGASDYISKPVDIDQLLSLLRVWLYA